MSCKYRTNKIKQEHTIIDDIYPLLLKVSDLEEVHSIIPGRINRRAGNGGIRPHLCLKYNTPTGIKMIAKTNASLQEVFVVTDYPETTIQLLKELSFVK